MLVLGRARVKRRNSGLCPAVSSKFSEFIALASWAGRLPAPGRARTHEPITEDHERWQTAGLLRSVAGKPATAEPDTIQRVYRLLAQRYHPDNNETGHDARFREIHEAYVTLSDPAKRAKYDIYYHHQKQDRWKLVSAGARAEDDFEIEQISRLTVLEALHAKRRLDPEAAGMPLREIDSLTGRPREHLQFTIWYLVQRKLVQRDDSSQLLITADGGAWSAVSAPRYLWADDALAGSYGRDAHEGRLELHRARPRRNSLRTSRHGPSFDSARSG